MTRQVFISHSATDRDAAEAIGAAVEATGVSCWIAPRDIAAGTEWADAIMAGIAEARVVLLVHSTASAGSQMVRREVNAAVDGRKQVIPVRIDSALPQDGMQFYLGSTHWLDASVGALQVYLPRIVAAVAERLGTAGTPAAPSVASEAPALPDKPSLVVLPFQNMSGDPEQEYFADGMVDDITSALSRIGWLLVMGRNTAFTYKGRTVDSRQVGRELGVRYVLEGSVRKAGGRVRITCQLIEAAGGHQVWTERFDGDLADIFDLQDRITESVVGAIEPSMQRAEIARAAAKPTASLDAYDLYLRALPLCFARTRESMEEAVGLLRQALAIDPNYVRAKAFLGSVLSARVIHGLATSGDREAAIGLARDVVASGTDDPEALRYASDPLTLLAGDHPAAFAALHRALRLHPNSAVVLNHLGLVHCFANDPAPAIAYCERAIHLSPLDPEIGYMLLGLGRAHLMLRHDALALPFLQRCVQELPNFSVGQRFLIHALTRLGRVDEARAVAVRLLEVSPGYRFGPRLAELPPDFYNPAFKAEHRQALLAAGLPE